MSSENTIDIMKLKN